MSEERILNDYPGPIAHAYSSMIWRRSFAAGVNGWKDTLEALLHYLGTVVVSAYVRTPMCHADANQLLSGMLLKYRGWTTGELLQLLREMTRFVGSCDGLLPYRELPEALFKSNGKPSAVLRTLEEFVTVRNKEIAHATGLGEAECEKFLEKYQPVLTDLLHGIPWLGEWWMIRPVVIDEGAVAAADVLNGCTPKPNQQFALTLGSEDEDIRADQDDLLLVHSDRSRYLPLSPLSLFKLGDHSARGDSACLLQELGWKRQAAGMVLKRAVYVGYREECQRYAPAALDRVAGCFQEILDRLQPSELTTHPKVAEPEEGDPDHRIQAVRLEQQFHLRMFVGRGDVVEEIQQWIDQPGEGRYLLLLGAPGEGKSALMAKLAAMEEERDGCLLHMIKTGGANPLRFLPSFISQVHQLTRINYGREAYEGDLEQLRNEFVRRLEDLKAGTGRAVVVIDALDELPSERERVTFLPQHLPDGVRVILTCRPDIPLVKALQGRLRACLDERQLMPMTASDWHLFLEKQLEVGVVTAVCQQMDLEEVYRKLEGNALLLYYFATQVRKAWDHGSREIDPETMATTREDVFSQIYEEIREQRSHEAGAEQGVQRSRLLHWLCTARESLTIRQLCDLENATGHPMLLGDCRDQLENLSQWLIDTGTGAFKPWHKGLTDHVVAQRLGDEGVRQLEHGFCQWLKQASVTSPYSLRHHLDHLLAANELDQAVELLTSLRYLEAKAESGMIFDLVKDFTKLLHTLPVTHTWHRNLELIEEAIRQDIHALNWQPSILFQCLWNRCWWYDTPEAAGHYELSDEQQVIGNFPWQRAEPKLCTLLERWREEKEQSQPGFIWLRSLRPPTTHLGTALKMTFQGHTEAVEGVDYSPDGTMILSGSDDGTVRVWDAFTGAQILCFPCSKFWVLCVCCSPDDSRIAIGCDDDSVQIWDAVSGEHQLRVLGHEGAVNSVSFAPDGSRIISGSDDGTICIWDAGNGQELLRTEADYLEVHCVRFSPDGKQFVGGFRDRTVRVFDSSCGKQLLRLVGHNLQVRSVDFSPDGARIVSGAEDNTIHVWDARTGDRIHTLVGHTGRVISTRFAPNGRWIASGSEDSTVRVWDSISGEEAFCHHGQFGRVMSVQFSPDGTSIVSGSDDSLVRLWGIAKRENLISLPGHRSRVCSIQFSPDHTRILSYCTDGKLCLWDVDNGKTILQIQTQPSLMRSVRFTLDGARIELRSQGTTIQSWNAVTGERIEVGADSGWRPTARLSIEQGLEVSGETRGTRSLVVSKFHLGSAIGHSSGEAFAWWAHPLTLSTISDSPVIVTGIVDDTEVLIFTIEGNWEEKPH